MTEDLVEHFETADDIVSIVQAMWGTRHVG